MLLERELLPIADKVMSYLASALVPDILGICIQCLYMPLAGIVYSVVSLVAPKECVS